MDLGCAPILLTCIAGLLFGNWLIARPFLIRAAEQATERLTASSPKPYAKASRTEVTTTTPTTPSLS
jgi:TfoX/Sxy family transcriptional regulator of competence genes